MHPLLFKIPIPFTDLALPVHTYGLMIALGFGLGVWLAARRAWALGIQPADIVDMGLFGAVAGVVGARLFHVLENHSVYSPFQPTGFEPGRLAEAFAVWDGGLVFYGAMLAAVGAAWWLCRRRHVPLWAFFDLLAPSLIAGQAVGRWGCFSAGCCYGKVCPADFFAAVHFPDLPPAYSYSEQNLVFHLHAHGLHRTLPVYPTQLFASFGAALIAATLYTWWPRRRFDGQIFAGFLLLVGCTRFLEELLRADNPAAFPTLSTWLTISQWISMAMIVVGALLLIVRRNKNVFVPKTGSLPV